MANENKTFVEELKEAFGGVAALIRNRINEIGADIDTNMQNMQTAYDNIKADKAEIAAITGAVFEFATEVEGYGEDGMDITNDSGNILADCADLIRDGYIEDEDYEKTDEIDEDEVPEDEQEDGFVEPFGDEE